MTDRLMTSCPKHPQARKWAHHEGDRCAICGRFEDGRDGPPAEPTEFRSFASFDAFTRTKAGPDTGHGGKMEYWAGCVAEEGGECFGVVKKHVYHGHPFNRSKLIEEIGDTLHCLTQLARVAGTSLEEAAAFNKRKLDIRFPNGYTNEDSMRRVDVKRSG